MSFSREDFNSSFRQGFVKKGDALSRSTLIQALGSHVVYRIVETESFVGNKLVTKKEKPVQVTDEDEIMKAIELLADEHVSFIEQEESDGERTVTRYYVIEKQKPDWRAAQALWEYELGKATQKAEVRLDAKVTLAELLSEE